MEMIETELIKQSIDKDLLQKRFRCASKTYDKHATVQRNMAQQLVECASTYIPRFHHQMMELGCGTGLLTNEIVQNFTCERYIANDLVAEVEDNIHFIVNTKSTAHLHFMPGDAENINIPQQQDIIWSGATIQWIDDLDTFFLRLSSALNENGFVAISSFDMENFKEIKKITGKGINYKTMDEVLGFASSYFNVLDCKSWQEKIYFESPKDVLKHMRFTGVNAISNTKWSKGDLEQFNLDYEILKEDKGYPLSYNPFVFILQKK